MDLTDKYWNFPRFFLKVSTIGDNKVTLTGGDAAHIGTVLRFKKGDFAVICDGQGVDCLARLLFIEKELAEFEIIEKRQNEAEPDVYIRLFQCVPKADKLEFIVQKSVELGVSEIFPVISKRCVSRPDEKNQVKKRERLQKIAEEAAKQSGRGKIPLVNDFTLFNDAVSHYKKNSLGIILYERGGLNINEIINAENVKVKNIDIFIGSEGGFEEFEVNFAENAGIKKVYLGNRILRTETAPVAIISILMNLTGNL